MNLEKARKLPISTGNTKKARLVNWAKFIDAETKEERKMLALSSPILELLNEKVIEITRSPEEQRLFDSRMKMRSDILTGLEVKFKQGFEEGLEKGIERGIERGIEKGRIEGLLETVKAMKEEGFSIEQIQKISGLTREEIERI